jgi:hypothetical protein
MTFSKMKQKIFSKMTIIGVAFNKMTFSTIEFNEMTLSWMPFNKKAFSKIKQDNIHQKYILHNGIQQNSSN